MLEYIIKNVSKFIWHAVLGKISQSRDWVYSSAQGLERKVTVINYVYVQGRCEPEMHKKVEDDVLHSFNNFRLLPLALSTSATRIFWITTIGKGLLAIIFKLLLQIQMCRK